MTLTKGEVIRSFPRTFGLRAYDGTFRISELYSYYDDEGTLQLYTEVLVPQTNSWECFAKCTVEELLREVVE